MSKTEHHKGTLIEVVQQLGESKEQLAERIVNENGYHKNEYHDTYLECLSEEGYREYHITLNSIYKVECQELDPCDDISTSRFNENGDIDFEVRYYNGGGSFDEAVDSALKNLSGEPK